MRITVGGTTINTTPEQDAGLVHWGIKDNSGHGSREPLTGEQLIVRLIANTLDLNATDAKESIEQSSIEKVKAILRDPAKADEMVAIIEAKAAEGK